MNLTDRLITAIMEKCDGLSITAEQASNILAYLQYGAPLARQPAAIDKNAVRGWKLVPVEPTKKMIDEAKRYTWLAEEDATEAGIWRHMISAAPLDKSESDALTALSTQNPIYAYEWDHSPGVVHRSFSNAPYNGRQPDRTLSLYAAALDKVASKPAAPKGWKLAMVERSYDMRAKAIIAFNTAEQSGKDRDDALDAAWQAMLAASPAAPSEKDGRND